jgi:hypothetical protein
MPDREGSLAPDELRERDRSEAQTIGVDRAFDQGMHIGITAIGIGGLLFLWQLYRYARLGVWPSVSVADALAGAGSAWARSPTDWFGLHDVFTTLPASLTLGALGVLSAWLWYHLRKWYLNRAYGP